VNVRSEDQRALAREWLEAAIAAYPPSAAEFLLRERSPFRNPLGHALREHLPAVLDALVGSADEATLATALEPIMRIGAVQDAPASESVRLLFLLKPILRARWTRGEEALRMVEARIDAAALAAFDLFVACREKIYAIKADEARRRVAHLERVYLGRVDTAEASS